MSVCFAEWRILYGSCVFMFVCPKNSLWFICVYVRLPKEFFMVHVCLCSFAHGIQGILDGSFYIIFPAKTYKKSLA